jgi:hypothetical protein
VHLSAIGIDRETPTAFSRSKLAGDRTLMSSRLDWVILRPSVVVGRAAYGGSALLRGLAALPILPVMPDTAPLQVVHLDDLVETIVFFLQPGAPARVVLEIAGPKRWPFEALVSMFRRWLRWPPASIIRLPRWLSIAAYWPGDVVSLLGWRPPIRTTARRELVRGAVGDPRTWTELTGIAPRDLEAQFAAEPASVQERWFAGLYVLKPLVFGVLSLFWIGTGLISLGPGFEIGKDLMTEAGATSLAGPSVVAGALADIIVGLAIALRATARPALYAALALSLFYAVAGTILLPRLWIEPLGPMLKIWPIFVLIMVALAIRDDR